MALIKCSECNNQISDKATICVKCGAPVIIKQIEKCFECDTELEQNAKTCPNCGAEQDANPNILEKNKKESAEIPKEKPNSQIKETTPKVEVQIVKVKSKTGGWIIFLLVLAIGLFAGYQYLKTHGYNNEAIMNSPDTYDLSVNCEQTTRITNLVRISNTSSRTHHNVTLRITAYDQNDNIIKVKTITIDRTIEPNSEISRPITTPLNTNRCDCVVESSDPY